MYKLHYFVPTASKESTKEALFAIGCGRYANYDKCAFETLGTGQFRPLQNANPTIGELDTLERVQEYKVEMIVPSTLISKAIETLKKAHPYEEVAYEVFKMEHF